MEASVSTDASKGSNEPDIAETETKNIPIEGTSESGAIAVDNSGNMDADTTTDKAEIVIAAESNDRCGLQDVERNETTAIVHQQQQSVEMVTEQMEKKLEITECVGEDAEGQVDDVAAPLPDTEIERPGSLEVTEGASGVSGPGGPSGASATSSQGSSPHQSVYHIKWIKWKDGKAPVILQNENGPCPLIALMNVLILAGKIQLPPMMEMITADQLMEYLGDCMLEYAPKNITDIEQLNYEQNMHDAMAIFPKLQTGLDVNVQFTGVRDFEYTPECIIFDLLGILLYHGWLVDPQTPDVAVVGKLSYNQLVEKIITDKSSPDSAVVTEALIAEAFLERTASQLTIHGLCELNATVNAGELAILFRNNHFSTIYKHQSELFQLVTDQGFLTESNVVWETLSNIDGDGQFVDFNFVTVPPRTAPAYVPSCNAKSDQQIDQDYLVALSLQEEQKAEEESHKKWEEYKQKQLGISPSTADEELARRLQAEEEKRAAEAAPEAAGTSHQPPTTSNSPNVKPNPKKKNDCRIL